MRHIVLFALTLLFFGCQSPDVPDELSKSVPPDTIGKIDSVEAVTEKIFFDTTVSQEQFLKEVDDYSKTVVNNVPPKPCGEYILRSISGFRRTNLKNDSLLYTHCLCEEIKKYEEIHNKSLRDNSPYGCWYYTFTPIGEKYYIIKGTQMINAINEITFYYQRKGD